MPMRKEERERTGGEKRHRERKIHSEADRQAYRD